MMQIDVKWELAVNSNQFDIGQLNFHVQKRQSMQCCMAVCDVDSLMVHLRPEL